MSKNTIEIENYDAKWPLQFQQEAALIQQALGSNCITIHHVGSTSVPGLAAKPIIDMIPVVNDIVIVDVATSAMEKLGYTARGEAGMLFRRYFQKGAPGLACNIHVYENGAGEVDRLVKFRDWLREHEEDKEAYAQLKRHLASQYSNDMMKYNLGKENFILNIDNKTGYDGIRIVQALTDREWRAYHRIREQEIFSILKIKYDPDHSCFNDANHFHLVMYKKSDIVGVAQLEYLQNNEVALRPFAIDSAFQNKGLGAIFLGHIERWLRQRDRKLLRLHAHIPAVQFYERLGYIKMPFMEERGCPVETVDMGKEL